MWLKRRIVIKLDEYENLQGVESFVVTRDSHGVRRVPFIIWFLKQEGSEEGDLSVVSKCINDCIEDGYIRSVYVPGETPEVYVMNDNGLPSGKTRFEPLQIENLLLTSRGRELKEWYFFYPALLQKMSLKEIALYAITTAVAVVVASLGLGSI